MTLAAKERLAFDALLLAIASAFSAEGRPGGDAAAVRLRAASKRPFYARPARDHPGALLRQVCALDNAIDCARLVLGCAASLDWEHWQGTGLADDVSNSLYTTELLGPDGHVRDNEVRVGLLVSEAGTDYPPSSHAAEETYFVIAGKAEWVLEGAPYWQVPPGSFVHHPAWAVHGRRTLSEPFLGAWRWSGNLDLASFGVARR
ncbi:dimethylsulfonioproprionate lyase family protein [Roseibium album]|uniref:Cupin domain protein n=1 Tax=Roseibium album TaxID=311410 RepID=A0A0M6ZQZ3_9HYPH|nr:dimethylsulfonioproprionate lyase family protein [Roseibium album]CTQ59321.1 Cupin domain protein [Roseibium album]CTQ64757.1 Cupin domain protein [Roseibium album]CTQ74662.1 Cupin domain protein [Roseibium album]